MSSLVQELQQMARLSATDIGELLRTAKVVASKLGLLEDTKWIDGELCGYSGLTSILPTYRVIQGELRAKHPHGGLIPIQATTSSGQRNLNRVYIAQSVAAIAELARDTTGYISFPCSAEVSEAIRNQQEWFAKDWLVPFRQVQRSQLIAILDAVRVRILNWALDL